jgi:phosphatidate cytidylyltransferase
MTAPSAGTSGSGRDLRAAIVVGAGLLAALAAAVAGPPWLLALLVLVLLGAGLVEAGGVMADAGRPVDVDVLLAVAVAAVAGALLGDAGGLLVALALLPVAALLRGVLRGGGPGVLDRTGRTVLLGAWVVGLGAHAVLLRGGEDGAAAVLAVVAAVAVADTAAYAVGSRIGRRPLAPRISPNKTVEGVVAGLVAAGIVGALALPAVGLVADPVRATVFMVAVAGAGVLGDLAESMLKRDLGVKDLGRALPGHGGVLDRVDALLLALPVGHHLLALLG